MTRHERTGHNSGIPLSPELEEHTVQLHAATGEAARHGEIKQRITGAMGSVDKLHNAWLNHLLTTEPTATDERLADLLSQVVNHHKVPAIFAVKGAYVGEDTTRAYTSVRMADKGQFMTPDSLRVTRQPNDKQDETAKTPFKFTVELDYSNLKIIGMPTTPESFATAIFTDFDTYDDQPVPNFLYHGDISRGEGGWDANARLLEGLVDEQFQHVGIPRDWDA